MGKKKIEYPLAVLLEAVLMGNGEVIHYGKLLGFVNKKQLDLFENEVTKLSRGNKIVVAVRKNNVA